MIQKNITIGSLGHLVGAPSRAGQPRHHLGELRAALDDGWQITQPVIARPLWSSVDDRETAFHFVLTRDRATRLVTVPESRTITKFIRDRSLTIQGRPSH